MRKNRIVVIIAIVITITTTIIPKEEIQVEGKTKLPAQLPAPLPLLLIPGFAGSQLYAWREQKCNGLLSLQPGGRIWLDVRKLMASQSCWLECMLLDKDQNDLPNSCKARPGGSAIETILELDPGLITGPLSSLWSQFHAE